MGKCLICIQLAFACEPVAPNVVFHFFFVACMNNEVMKIGMGDVGFSQYLNELFPHTMTIKFDNQSRHSA